MAKMHQTFTVEGTGDFPFDMLRYDQCWPAQEGQSHLLDSNEIIRDQDWLRTPRQVKMKRHVEGKGVFPTVARWKSFGWRVLEDTIETSKYA